MSSPENEGSSSMDDNGDPPPLSIKLTRLGSLPKTLKPSSDVQLPVDILLLTVENCEFLACHYYLRNAFKSYFQSFGYAYFGNMGDQQKPWKVALVRCSRSDPGGSQTVAKNAVTQLRPKVTFCVGSCQGLSREKAKLGDVVISSKLTTDAYKTPVSKDVGNLIRNAADGWEAPLENPEARDIQVHCDGEILSCPDPVSVEQQCKLHPGAIAAEREGKGIFAAAHDMKSEWVVVKGVSHFADSSTCQSWETFACVMAASVVSNILCDPFVFEHWPHYGEEGSSTISTKRDLPISSSQDAKRVKLMTSDLPESFDLTEFQRQIQDIYNTTTDTSAAYESSKRDLPCSSHCSDLEQSSIAEEDTSIISTKRDLPFSTSQDPKRIKFFTSDLSAQLTEQHMNEQQELDQYKEHDTWLELIKGDDISLFGLLREKRTDQQQKQMNLFLARFRHHFTEYLFRCNGCHVNLSGRYYRCLDCIDVAFCYDCYVAGIKLEENHTENHEVIEIKYKCGVCKGFILGTRFCCYECEHFFLCIVCQSRHPAAHKVTKFPMKIKKEPFVEECQKQLQSHYNTFSKVKIVPWEQSSAVHIDEIYTQLSWVRDDRKPSGVTQEELEDYTDICKGDKHHPNPKRILVFGRPGIGKSTFSKKTAIDWSQQEKRILMKFDLVLLVKLRDVCNLRDIRDVLKASKLLSGDGVISVDDVFNYIRDNQEKVLLILDGYDEYSCTGEQSPVRDIWESSLLRDCHVIITTRYMKVDELRCPSHVQFEINGFKSENQIRAFARRFLKDKEDVDEFVKDLKEKGLKAMAEIPLLLLMLCLLWKGKHQSGLPKSRAGLYTGFIQTLLDHLTEKDADAKQFRKVDDYKEELCKLGKLAFGALLQDCLSFHVSELPDDIFSTKLIDVGLIHVQNVASLTPEKDVVFIHKSLQEFLAAFYLKEEVLKEQSTGCLSEVDSFEKILKMVEVLKFAYELSAEAACAALHHLGMVGKKEGLIEYNFTETPSIGDLPIKQQLFLNTFLSHCFFCCAVEKRRDLYSMFLSYVGGVLLIDPDQLHSVAEEHLLKFAEAPEFIFFSYSLYDKHTEQSYHDLITVVEDLNAVLVSCSGENKASDFLIKYQFPRVDKFFLKKEGTKMNIYMTEIRKDNDFTFPTEMLKESPISSPEPTQKKKSVGGQSNEQDNRTTLCLTENNDSTTDTPPHCLSCVSDIGIVGIESQEMETLVKVLPFVSSPRRIHIFGKVGAPELSETLTETLVSRINFTNRLAVLQLERINLTAKAAAVIARSLPQAPNLRVLNLSSNPLGEGVSDLTRHLSCVPRLKYLRIYNVKMTKKQVTVLTEPVRQSNISTLLSSYHDEKGNPEPEHKWPTSH
ncbi:uncharacterized protein LOC144652677 [Oculina patagonica]